MPQEQNPFANVELMSDRVLQQLANDTSPETVPMMLSVFLGEMEKRGQMLKELWAQKNYGEVREQAHALKSCSGTFGGLRLQEVAKQMEEASAAHASDDVHRLMPVLNEVMEITMELYKKKKASLEAADS